MMMTLTEDMMELIIIDDDPINNFIFRKMMEDISKDVTIRSFENAIEGLEYLKALSEKDHPYPSHILLDLNMPVYNGWQFLDDYENLQLHIKHHASLYVVSSTILKDEIEKARGLSFVTDFISKPLTPYKLKRLVETKATS